MSEECLATVEINQDLCSRCCVCYSICPYEAINYDREADKVQIDIQKCQVCGICPSACPVSAIKIAYYDYDHLLDYVDCVRKNNPSDTLVLMCRGNSPSTCEVEEILADQGLNVKDYIPLRLPCSGRIPTDFVFKTLNSGVKNIISVQCEDHFCRYKEGTKINARRFQLSKNVLKQLGFDENALKVVKYSRKAIYKTEECVGCDKCVFICPYEAITAEPFATPNINLEKCVGCGACALVCPHQAIEVKGFEFDNVLQRYSEVANKLKARSNTPTLLTFVCQWSEFSALDNPNSVFKGKNAMVLEVPCFKALDPVHVINALQCGFDGVMGVVCSAKDCKLEEGRDVAERNLDVLKIVLNRLGLQQRFEYYEASPRCESEFKKALDKFYTKLAALPQKEVAVEEAK
ncbi:hydrogenase iron-sulfur subunit [Candidatus Bathyarchaeota archaeon A05DMB-2]|jgi:coenzyme F420-reducing hydrogenase delta subunit|nr:hydrogenase iron-sulfur subunit [Candidatus Bathyarchaeota archaeon A05DMB-2]